MSDLQLEIPSEDFDSAVKDVENNELDLEQKENEAAKLKTKFHTLITHLEAIAHKAQKETPLVNAEKQSDFKPKFKP